MRSVPLYYVVVLLIIIVILVSIIQNIIIGETILNTRLFGLIIILAFLVIGDEIRFFKISKAGLEIEQKYKSEKETKPIKEK